MRTKKPRLMVVSSSTGEVFDADIQARRRSTTITQMYGPNWAAVKLPTLRALADDRDLSGSEWRMIVFLLSKMRDGNHIDLRPVDICREMGLRNGNGSVTLGKLRAKGIVFDRKPFGFRINPNLIWRGDPTGSVGKRRDGELVLL